MDERKDKTPLDHNPLNVMIAKFPMRFAKSVIFGPKPNGKTPVAINTATATLVNLPSGPTAITCEHVIANAINSFNKNPESQLQIGDVLIDINSQLIDMDKKLDVATIRLTSEQTKTITNGGDIGGSLFTPANWPPNPPSQGDFVAFGGFPGALRKTKEIDAIEFGTWSHGSSKIESSSLLQFVSPFEREHWVRAFGTCESENIDALGGMSGGPVLILRGLKWDLVGIIKEYNRNFDAMFFSSLSWVLSSGEIDTNML